MSRITYAAAAWRGFASPADCNSVQIFKKVKMWGIMAEDTSISGVQVMVDYNLFKKVKMWGIMAKDTSISDVQVMVDYNLFKKAQ